MWNVQTTTLAPLSRTYQMPAGVEEAGASLFVEPIAWMTDTVVGALQGKLYCPGAGCNARLGSFNWSGKCARMHARVRARVCEQRSTCVCGRGSTCIPTRPSSVCTPHCTPGVSSKG